MTGTLESEVAAARQDPRRAFGRFLVLSELGRGGMGVVYRAWDDRLRRVVALKLLGADADAAAVERFAREAQAIARLRHPSVVAIHDVGTLGGRAYIAMDFVDGATLAHRLREGTEALPKLSLRRAVEVVRDVARAVQHAHEQGVVHRDLKPQNVMVDRDGRAWVLDFGLARVRDAGPKLTKAVVPLGTPAYMPPEQAGDGSSPIDERSDVYSLGATLYEVLAGKPPFEGASNLSIITAVLTRDPVPPSATNPRAGGDLETICLRCLEKDPARRYPKAGELADDLDRWLAGDPIHARPIGRVERLVRRARRNKLATASLLLAVVSTLGLGGAAAWQWKVRLDEERARARQDRRESRRRDGQLLRERAWRELEEGRHRRAAVTTALAAAFADDPTARALHLVAREGAWTKPRAIDVPAGVRSIVTSATGLLGVLDVEDGLLVVDPRRAEPLRKLALPARTHVFAWSPDGQKVAVSTEHEPLVRVLDAETGAVAYGLELPGESGNGGTLSWTPDGRLLATKLGATIVAWDTTTRRSTFAFRNELTQRTAVYGLEFAPDGRRLLCWGSAGLWTLDARTGAASPRLEFGASVLTARWDPSDEHGDRLVVSTDDRMFRLVQLSTGRTMDVMRAPIVGTHAIAWSPDGRAIALGCDDDAARIWDVRANALALLEEHGAPVHGVAWSPDGSWLATAGRDRRVLVWTLGGDRTVRTLAAGVPFPSSIRWSPDAQKLAVGGHGAACIVDAATRASTPLARRGAWTTTVAWRADGKRLALGSLARPGFFTAWDVERSAATFDVRPDGNAWALDVGWSPDGALLVGVAEDGSVLFLDGETGSTRSRARPCESLFTGSSAHWLREPRRVLLAGSDGKVRLIDAATQKVEKEWLAHERGIAQAALSPDEKTLATCSADRSVRLWDLQGTLRRRLATGGRVSAVAFSPDGRLVASSGWDKVVRLWDAETGDLVASWPAGGLVSTLAFRPGGGKDLTLAIGLDEKDGRIVLFPVHALLEPRRHATVLEQLGAVVARSGVAQDPAFPPPRDDDPF